MKFFVPPPLAGTAIHPAFYFRYQPDALAENLFKEKVPLTFFEHEAEYAEHPEGSDVILLPNNFTNTTPAVEAYIKQHVDIAEKLHKPIYGFSCGDLTDSLVFDPRIQIFSYSLYRSVAQKNKISMPTLTSDIGAPGILIRTKEEIPTISFCGKAGFSSWREYVGSWIRRLTYEYQGLLHPVARAHIRGIFWRIWSLRACKNSTLVATRFIIRQSFSGALSTIEVSPEQARKEFLETVQESDFVLAPKGDGNYSNRFLEALAMGRIPVLIDTDVVLPLEDTIDYSNIVVRIPMHAVAQIPAQVRKWYDALTTEEWAARQQRARDTYIHYLTQDSFFKRIFLKS